MRLSADVRASLSGPAATYGEYPYYDIPVLADFTNLQFKKKTGILSRRPFLLCNHLLKIECFLDFIDSV